MRGIRGGGVPGVDWGRGSVGRAGSGTRGAGAGSQRERGAAPCPPHGPDAGPSPGPALRSPRPGPASRPSVPLRAGQALAAAGAPAAPQRWPGCLQEETQLLLLSQKPKKGEPKGWGWPAPSFRASLPPRHHSHPDLPARAAQAGTEQRARQDPGCTERRREGSVSALGRRGPTGAPSRHCVVWGEALQGARGWPCPGRQHGPSMSHGWGHGSGRPEPPCGACLWPHASGHLFSSAGGRGA